MGSYSHQTLIVQGDEAAVHGCYRACLILADSPEFKDPPMSAEMAALGAGRVATLISDVVYGTANSSASFAVMPDGSKLGWPPSDKARKFRAAAYDLAKSRGLRAGLFEFGEYGPAVKDTYYGESELKQPSQGEDQTLILNMLQDMMSGTDPLDGLRALDTVELIIANIRAGIHRQI